MSLNQEQRKAVREVEGRILVLAGAGSGKTRVIVHRIAYLIEEKGVSPSMILGLTFTNKAAAEMRERLSSLIGAPLAKEVTLSTFHSFCMQILRREIEKLGYAKNFSLYNEKDLERLIQQIAREILGCDGELPSLAATRAAIQDAANKGISDKESTWHDRFSKEVYFRLQSLLRSYNAVSFDNLISLATALFEKHPEVLEKYQDRFRYIMIDEYQDTNLAQFRLAELLSKKYRNLCVVGDDDQSIYGWRGAEVNHILHFEADQVIKLEQNYRSTPTILEAANAVISKNKGRHAKKLWSQSGESVPIEVFNAPTDVEEAQSIVERILHYKSKGFRWQEMAILYRSNALSRQLEMALLQASYQKEGHWVRGIPYEVFGGLEFSERSEIKDLLSYMRVIANPLDQEALLRILNVPRRGISDAFLDTLTQWNRTHQIPLWHHLKEVAEGVKPYPTHPKGVQGIRSFVDLIETAKARFLSEKLWTSLLWLIEKADYKRAIAEEVKSEKMRTFKWENIQECVNALAQYEEEITGEEKTLQGFLSDTTLAKQSFTQHTKKGKEDKVQLMTLHSAKGLEFPICFIAGLEDHILPHEKSVMTTGIEEERRLFYVGLTRARLFLTLSMARSRMRMGKACPTSPSRFLHEIPKHLLNITPHKKAL